MVQPTPFDLTLDCGIDISLLLVAALWGAICLSAVTYYRQNKLKSDPLYLKLAVALVWLSTTIFTVLQTVVVHLTLYTRASGPIEDLVFVTNVAGYTAQAIVQTVYAIRIFRFYNRLWIPLICWTGTACTFVMQCGFAYIVKTQGIENFALVWKDYGWLLSSAYTVAAVVDITVTATLCVILRTGREYVEQGTSRAMDKLLLWTVQTGLVTSLTALAIAILLKIETAHGYFMPVMILSVPLYSLTMIALLNGRNQLRTRKTEAEEFTVIELRPRSKQANDNVIVNSSDDFIGIGGIRFSTTPRQSGEPPINERAT